MEHKTRIQSNLKQNLKDSIQELHNHQQDVKQLQADNTQNWQRFLGITERIRLVKSFINEKKREHNHVPAPIQLDENEIAQQKEKYKYFSPRAARLEQLQEDNSEMLKNTKMKDL